MRAKLNGKKEILTRRKTALKYGAGRGLDAAQCEDFAQHVIMEEVCLTGVKNLRHHLCDFMRQEFGRVGSARSKATSRILHVGEEEFLPASIDRALGMADFGTIAGLELLTVQGHVHLTDLERKVFYLLLGGYTALEVSKIMKVTEQRISQQVRIITTKIADFYAQTSCPTCK